MLGELVGLEKYGKLKAELPLYRYRGRRNFLSIVKYKKYFTNYLLNSKKRLEFVSNNYRIMITFLSFMNSYSKNIDEYVKRKGIFGRRWMKQFLKFYVFLFVKKNVLKQYSMFFKILFNLVGCNYSINIFLLDNNSVNAAFIARFVAIGFKLRFNYKDMITPIKASLNKQMYVRKWSSVRKVARKKFFGFASKELGFDIIGFKELIIWKFRSLDRVIDFFILTYYGFLNLDYIKQLFILMFKINNVNFFNFRLVVLGFFFSGTFLKIFYKTYFFLKFFFRWFKFVFLFMKDFFFFAVKYLKSVKYFKDSKKKLKYFFRHAKIRKKFLKISLCFFSKINYEEYFLYLLKVRFFLNFYFLNFCNFFL